jgi:HD-like signal output (HDOD) protein
MQAYPTLEELVNEIAELRPIGAVATRILQLTEGDRFSAHELATVISSDQALTAKMLRLANSAYYGFPRRITTVRDAVVLLGFRAVRSATLASCVIDAVPGSTHINYQRFWHYSVSVGMLAEVLGRAHRVHQDEAFTAGVLHNIGRLALDQHAPQALQDALLLARTHQASLHEAEQRLLGYSDAELGGALALHWNFPAPLAQAVGQHVLRTEELPDPHSVSALVVRARAFARSYGLDDGVESGSAGPAPGEWSVPPVSVALKRAGGIEGVLDRVEAFMEHTVAA